MESYRIVPSAIQTRSHELAMKYYLYYLLFSAAMTILMCIALGAHADEVKKIKQNIAEVCHARKVILHQREILHGIAKGYKGSAFEDDMATIAYATIASEQKIMLKNVDQYEKRTYLEWAWDQCKD